MASWNMDEDRSRRLQYSGLGARGSGLGARGSGLGARGSGLGAREPALDDPATWLPLVHRIAQARCPASDVDDLVGDVLVELIRYLQAGNEVSALPGLVEAMVVSVGCRARRPGRQLLCVEPEVLESFVRPGTTPPAQVTWKQPPAEARVLRRRLRGHRQRWLFDQVLAGATSVWMASALGWPVKEVRAQLRDLLARVQVLAADDAGIPANSHRHGTHRTEPGDADGSHA